MQGLSTWAENRAGSSPSTVSPLRVAEIDDSGVVVFDHDPTTVAPAKVVNGFSAQSPTTTLGTVRQFLQKKRERSQSQRERQLESLCVLFELPNADAVQTFLPDDELTASLLKAAELIPQTFALTGKLILRGVADGDAGEFVAGAVRFTKPSDVWKDAVLLRIAKQTSTQRGCRRMSHLLIVKSLLTSRRLHTAT